MLTDAGGAKRCLTYPTMIKLGAVISYLKKIQKDVVLKNMLTILMMSAKVATPGLLKIKLFLNKGYDVIISFRGVSNKIFSCDSN